MYSPFVERSTNINIANAENTYCSLNKHEHNTEDVTFKKKKVCRPNYLAC